MNYRKSLIALLLAGTALGLASPAFAAPADRISQLEKQLQALSAELEALKKDNEEQKATVSAQVEDLLKAQSAQVQDNINQRAAETKTTIANGRPTWTSGDGKFSASLRALLQYDASYYSQDRIPGATTPAPDLSSGTNLRRARIGVEGKFFGDWSYSFIYENGGTALPVSSISDAYVQYNGLAPVAIRFGSFATPNNVEDQTGTGDLLFLERAAPADVARNIGGADGRQNYVGVSSAGDDYYGAVSLSGARSNDATVYSDEQLAVVGRAAYRVYKDADTNVILSGSGTYVVKTPDVAASPAGASNFTLQISPEASVDDQNTRLVTSGAINAQHVSQWGLEAAANYQSFYVQGGYFKYEIDRRASVLLNPSFDGWYAQGSWILTGERRRYQTATATWAAPQPAKPFDFSGEGWGALELAGRYSVVDLNYLAGSVGAAAPSASSIRGGKQDIWTAGLNWYPNNNVRFLLDYQHVKVDRIGTSTVAPIVANTQIGQELDIISLRTQLAF